MKEKSLKINVIMNILKVFSSVVFPLVTFPYVSRILLPSGVGKVNFAVSIISYFILISSLGINTYGIREASKYRHDKDKLTKLVKEIFTINMIFTLISYVLLILSVLGISFLSDYKNLLFVLSIQIIATTIGFDWLYVALEEYVYITFRTIAFQFLSLILLFIFVKDANDTLNYAVITLVSSSGFSLLNFIRSRKYINWFETTNLRLKNHLKPIFIIFFLNLSVSIYTNLDSVMLGVVKGNSAVGIYTSAVKIIKIIGLLITALGSSLLPRLAFYIGEKDEDKFNDLIKKSLNFVLMISVPAVIGVFVLSPQIIRIISGNSFLAAILPMRIMCIIILFLSLSNLTGMQILVPTNRENILVFSVAITAVANFVLNLFLIPKFGVIGASISTVIAEFIATGAQIIFLRQYFIRNKLFGYISHYLISGVIMGLVVAVVAHYIKGDYLVVLVSILIGAAVYGLVCLYIFKNPFAIEFLNSLTKSKLSKLKLSKNR